MTIRGRAAVLRTINEPFSIEEVEWKTDDPKRVIVKTHASPFCSTDVKNWKGQLYKIPPTILGHASIGEIVWMGADVEGFKIGQRVSVPGTPECGHCYYCSIGEVWQCGELFDLGGIYPDIAVGDDGAEISCAGCVGGYAEYMSISMNQIFPLDSDLDSVTLSMLGCGITAGVGSIFNVAQVKPGESVAIVGAGHLGLWAVQAARLAGASQIIVVEWHEGRAKLAEGFGADAIITPGRDYELADEAVAEVKRLTGGRGVDVSLEAAGPTAAQRLALLASRRAARVVYAGFEIGGAQLTIPQVETALQSRQIRSSQNGQVHMRSDLQRYTEMIERGLLSAEGFVTRTYDVAELDLARDRSGAFDDVCGIIAFDH